LHFYFIIASNNIGGKVKRV